MNTKIIIIAGILFVIISIIFGLKYYSETGNRNIVIEKNENVQQKPAVIVFIKDDVSINSINALVSELKTINGVKQVKYISQEEALQIYKETNKNELLLLEMATPNILPQSIEVYLNDFSVRNQVEKTAKSKPFVGYVSLYP